MSRAPTFLADDGTASVATMLLMSHHAFRRDLALFGFALAGPAPAGAERATALAGEWRSFHEALHGHHTAEDMGLFPQLSGAHPELGPVIAELGADHRRIDPLLAQGDAAFERLAEAGQRQAAAALVAELSDLLARHLATEEASVVQHLRAMTTFAMPVTTDAEADMMAQGFAWSSQGVAPEVLERAYAMLPGSVTSRIPAARAAFVARCERVWGVAREGASRTALPDWLGG